MRMKKSTLLASAVALAASMYLPAASAIGTDTFTLPTTGGTITGETTLVSSISTYTTIDSYLQAANPGAFDFILSFTDPSNSGGYALTTESWNLAFDDGSFAAIQYILNGGSLITATDANNAYDVNGSTSIIGGTTGGTTTLEVTGIITNKNVTSGHYTLNVTLPNNASVPEPEMLSMMLLGLPLIGWMSRRKQVA
ncbi:PEP-CTERM sorting domain-containing protein [Methylomonas sp. AM2-LC]|uniref:PEP-CTERM sorting domain-containing protein n=1 Tax=Methylomonas sp. AM2-LC TaxID=3153301 RepID=UPI0032635B0A